MKLSTILILIGIGILLGWLSDFLFEIISETLNVRKNRNKKRYCHHCKMAYLDGEDNDVNYCRTCGRKLQYISEINPPQTEEPPFEDFNEKEQ